MQPGAAGEQKLLRAAGCLMGMQMDGGQVLFAVLGSNRAG